MFLSAPVTPAEPWSLSTGRSTILFTRASDEQAQVRPPGSIVLGVFAVADELHDHEFVGIVAGHAVEVVSLAVVYALDVGLMGVVADAQPAPVDAVGNGLVHLGADELIAIALVDDDVFRLDPGRLEPLDDLEHQLARRVGQGVAHRIHLHPDDVARLEEAPPGLNGVVGSGELLHAAIDGLLDRLAVLDVVLDHARIADFDDTSGVRPRDAPFLIGLGLASRRLGLLGRNVGHGHSQPSPGPRLRHSRTAGGPDRHKDSRLT